MIRCFGVPFSSEQRRKFSKIFRFTLLRDFFHKPWRKTLFVFSSIVILLPLYAYFIEPCAIRVKRYEIVSKNIPDDFHGVKIVFLTDLHHGTSGSFDLRNQIVKLTQKENPDLILLGGDYYNESEKSFEECFAMLGKLSAPLGVYGV